MTSKIAEAARMMSSNQQNSEFASAITSNPRLLQNWVNNTPVPTKDSDIHDTAKFLPVTNPSNEDIISYVPLSTPDDVNFAVESAHEAFIKWSARTIKDRIQILIRFHQLIIKHSNELAEIIIQEHGKTRSEALAEISKGNETLEYAISLPQLVQGRIMDVSRGVTCQDSRLPLGVVASIVPFNFPFMVPFWTLPIIIGLGNTLVLKPSEKVPMTMMRVMEILKEAGVPDGVVNLVHGTVKAVETLVDHSRVKAITFVGTSHVAESLSKRARTLNKRALCLGGAKNHLVAFPDCNISMTAQDVVNSFTGCSGQRCMAASVLLCVEKSEDLITSIIAKASTIKFGQRETHHMGPVIDSLSKEKIFKYINDSEASGAKILLDGRGWNGDAKRGHWIGPTVILHGDKRDTALHDEIFGPVLSIYVCASKEEAIEFENSNPYGNAACIYTKDGGVAEWFSRRFSAGMIGVNVGVPVPREPFSFGGINRSRFGDCDITGDDAINFFTYRRKITTKWAAPEDNSWMS